MKSNEQIVLELKQILEQRKEERSRLLGQRDEMLRRLATEFNCGSVEEAEALMQKLQDESEALAQKIENDIKRIQQIIARVA